MVYHKLLLIVDKFIGPMKKAGESTSTFFKGYADKSNTLIRKNSEMGTSISQLEKQLQGLQQTRVTLTNLFDMKAVDRQISEVERKLQKMGAKPKSANSSGPVPNMLGGAATMAGAAFGITEIFSKTAEIEKLGAMFRTSFGDQATAAFTMVSKVAQKTPYEMTEVAESFIKLKNRGFEPTENMMMQISDTSSSMGKGYLQVVEAMLDATTGHTVRLDELGIAAEVQGNKLKVLFKDGEHVYDKSNAGIQKMIEDYSRLGGVQGSSAAQMAALGGMLSNFVDKLAMTLAAIGTAIRPLIAFALEAGGVIFNLLNGTANWIIKNSELVGNFLLGATITALLFGTGWAIVNAQFLYFSILTKMATAYQWLLNAAMMANPIFIIGGAIVLVGGLLGMMLAKFQPVADFFEYIWLKIKAIGKAIASFMGIDLSAFDSSATIDSVTKNTLKSPLTSVPGSMSAKGQAGSAASSAAQSSSPKITTINFGPMSFNINAIAKGGDMASMKELANEVAGHIAAGMYDVDVQFGG